MEPQPSTSDTQKRKRNVLSLEKKLQIIAELKKGTTAVALSNKFGVPRTTINDLKKNGNEIEKYASQMESMDGRMKQRKTMKGAANEALDKALYLWFAQKRSEGIPLSGPIVAVKALQFNTKLNGDPNFKASDGWLTNFKNRHGIRELNIEGEKLSAAGGEVVKEFQVEFVKIVVEMGLCRDQVYNCDETGLNFKALPTKTLAASSEKYAPGFKMQKERITVLVCANASGNHRLPLLVIGKAKRPRCFKGVNMDALPVRYCGQKSAWMEQDIFSEWFQKIFVPLVREELKSKNLPPKAVLLLDNAPTHPEAVSLQSDDGNIKCIFLPANTTSLVQPMDQSVIETFKRRYRKKFIEALISEDNVSLIDYWKAYNMKNVVYSTADAWGELSEETLRRSWNKLWPQTSEETVSETVERDAVTNEVLAQSAIAFGLSDRNELNEWLTCDDANQGYQLLTDDEIIEMIHAPEDTDLEIDAEYDDGSDAVEEVKDARKDAREAVAHLDQFIEWYSKQNDANQVDAILLRRLRNSAITKAHATVKQAKLTDFFFKTS